MTAYRATRPWTVSYPDPLQARAGEYLTVGDADDGWPGWVWCTSRGGKSGWTPLAWLERDGRSGVLLHDYNALELALSVGDVVRGLLTESGWLLAVAPDGREGWAPLECVEPLADSDRAAGVAAEIARLDSAEPAERLRAIRALGDSGDTAARAALAARLEQTETERQALLAAIQQLEQDPP